MARKIFTSADILIPHFTSESDSFEKWAVIACDQFTSDPSYWGKVEKNIDSSPSTYDYILPEAYLDTPKASEKFESFKAKTASLDSSVLMHEKSKISGFVYIERTLGNGKIRHGILGKLDLEEYDYSKDSVSNIRATEETVSARIPPRSALRAEARIELPHAMVFVDDRTSLYELARSLVTEGDVIYDFDLMQDGGHIKGYALTGDAALKLSDRIAKNEELCPLPYAVGDGNHSLAAAKAHYESVKSAIGEEALSHPARYALCEIVAIGDDAIEFEPIHRILKNVDPDDVLTSLSNLAEKANGGQEIKVITESGESVYSFVKTSHDMTVGTLQNFIDEYVAAHEGSECDYIHGEDELRALVASNSVAFMFDGFDKSKLFEYIKNGPMPRKTFSMGDARSKRYYLEARVIVTEK